MTSLPAQVLIAPIRFYQRFITPYTPATCRYYPTCSAYAVTALRTHGAFVGTGLTIWRLLRCNPWSSGGIDHVPAKGQLAHRQRDEPAESRRSLRRGRRRIRALLVHRERGEAAGSSSTVGPAEHRSAGTDLDAPPIRGQATDDREICRVTFNFWSLDYIYYPVSGIMWVWHKVFGSFLGPDTALTWVLCVVFLIFTLRAILFKPFMKQMDSQLKMQAVQPQMKKMREKYKDDKQRLSEEMMKLNKEAGVNPLASCLPALIQAPVFIGLFHVLRMFQPVNDGPEGPSVWFYRANVYFFGHADVVSMGEAKLPGGAPLVGFMTMPLDQLTFMAGDRAGDHLVGHPADHPGRHRHPPDQPPLGRPPARDEHRRLGEPADRDHEQADAVHVPAVRRRRWSVLPAGHPVLLAGEQLLDLRSAARSRTRCRTGGRWPRPRSSKRSRTRPSSPRPSPARSRRPSSNRPVIEPSKIVDSRSGSNGSGNGNGGPNLSKRFEAGSRCQTGSRRQACRGNETRPRCAPEQSEEEKELGSTLSPVAAPPSDVLRCTCP